VPTGRNENKATTRGLQGNRAGGGKMDDESED